MRLQEATELLLPALEAELRRQIARVDSSRTRLLYEMLSYHMGWEAMAPGTGLGGKRLRPLLLLLIIESVGGDWRNGLPAAAALEIVHNFSLVHDDIQDDSPTRRGREALWKKYGIGSAINAGDSLFTIAHQALLDLVGEYDAQTVLKVAALLQQACLDMTCGQFLDLEYQRRPGLTLDDYWFMIEAKTAALLAAAAEIGAIIGGASDASAEQYRAYGRLLGLAFQVQDDILGVWGSAALTGKSTASDLVDGKSSLPILYAASRDRQFAKRWITSPIRADEVAGLAGFLKEIGAYDYAIQTSRDLTGRALTALHAAEGDLETGAALVELTKKLLGRPS